MDENNTPEVNTLNRKQIFQEWLLHIFTFLNKKQQHYLKNEENIILQFKFTNVDNPLNVEAAETTITIFFSRAKYKKTNKIDPISNLLSLS